jgi:hypothetical protein
MSFATCVGVGDDQRGGSGLFPQQQAESHGHQFADIGRLSQCYQRPPDAPSENTNLFTLFTTLSIKYCRKYLFLQYRVFQNECRGFNAL